MISSLFRHGSAGESQAERASLVGRGRVATQDYSTMMSSGELRPEDATYEDDDDHALEDDEGNDGDEREYESDEDGGDSDDEPILPMFSSSHLDALPTYNLTHTIRMLIGKRCETTLTWEQLRSPQVSQFLVKPIQQEIVASHLNRATIYAILANCLQFSKEAQVLPGNSGVLRTRAAVAELLAMRLLKEFSTIELIDALSYDFDPLVGMAPPQDQPTVERLLDLQARETPYSSNSARTSTMEVAIRAQAKRFIAHPLVVQHLEAIWAGAIVFHSAADSLHRMPAKSPSSKDRYYSATHRPSQEASSPTVRKFSITPLGTARTVRRAVTIYDPANASLFKLSRLRVPRYRQTFTTLSYLIMVGLFLAILVERSLTISALEVVFWVWSAGFLLAEIVGITEQGLGLYILSFWNLFDVGTILLFIAYYILRIYGIALYREEKENVAIIAYDLLGSSAILLFPRIFSFLDHYRYFSQLLIAFRIMVQDLVAVMILIGVVCSGFFVAFTLSFGNAQWTDGSVAYGLFQLLMGYTPAAWDVWKQYDALGKTLLTIFLFLTHFLVVTMLISVLTNSFTAVVKNADEEHQYLFAINVLSSVKSDALFSYIAPTNVLGWLFSPMRYMVPFRQYVRVNRAIIKGTHFPVLLLIYVYEKARLGRFGRTPIDLLEQRGRADKRSKPFGFITDSLFTPGARVREPSIATFRKDRALDEVFRKPYTGTSTFRRQSNDDRRSNVVSSWMSGIGQNDDDGQSEAARSMLEGAETFSRRPGLRHGRFASRQTLRLRDPSPMVMSMASDLDDSVWKTTRRHPRPRRLAPRDTADAEGGAAETTPLKDRHNEDLRSNAESDYFHTRDFAAGAEAGEHTNLQPIEEGSYPTSAAELSRDTELKRSTHQRQTSTSTMIYSPIAGQADFSERPGKTSATSKPPPPRRSSPKRASKVTKRPPMPFRDSQLSAPNFSARMASTNTAQALDLASEFDGARFDDVEPDPNILSGSFETQMEWANRNRMQQRDEESRMMSRIVLSRMNTLEEGFKDILKEVKDLKYVGSDAARAGVQRQRAAVKGQQQHQSPAADDRKGKEKTQGPLSP